MALSSFPHQIYSFWFCYAIYWFLSPGFFCWHTADNTLAPPVAPFFRTSLSFPISGIFFTISVVGCYKYYTSDSREITKAFICFVKCLHRSLHFWTWMIVLAISISKLLFSTVHKSYRRSTSVPQRSVDIHSVIYRYMWIKNEQYVIKIDFTIKPTQNTHFLQQN